MSLGMGHDFIVVFGDGDTPTREVDGMGMAGSIEGLVGDFFTAPVQPAANAIVRNRMKTPK